MRWLALMVAVPLTGAGAAPSEPEPAAEISRKSRERGSLNLVGLSVELKLTSVGKDGTVREQVLRSSAKKIDGRDCSVARFLSPPGVAGVAVLTLEGKGDEPSDISLYLPKLKRVRKVAKTQRGQAFMDTDFNYADLGGTGATQDEALHALPDQKVEGRESFVLTGTANAESPYGEVTVYVDKQTYVPLKAEYKDKDGKPFKVYRAGKLKKFKDRILAGDSTMENVQTGSKTRVEILTLEDANLGDEAFTERALERG